VARIPYVDPASASEPVREAFAQLPVHLNVFKLIAHAEDSFRPFLRYGGSILARQQLEPRLRELAILRVAKLADAEYEWVQHVPIARQAGVAEAQVAALERGEIEAACFDETERLLLAFTDDVVGTGRPPRERFEALARRLSARELVELVLAVGFYLSIGKLMTAFEIDLDPPAGDRVAAAIR
jgi:alkylhydroperoxidase family enzyme